MSSQDGTNNSYDSFFNRPSPLNIGSAIPLTAIQFDQLMEVQTNRVKTSSLIGTSRLASGTFSVPGNTIVNVTFYQNTKNTKNMSHAYPLVAIFAGTAAIQGSQIYPAVWTGSLGTSYPIIGSGYDWFAWSTGALNGTIPVYTDNYWNVVLENLTGNTGTFLGVSNWKFITNQGGTAAVQ